MSFQSCGGEGAEDVAQDSSLSRNSTSISNAYTPVHTQYREYRERRDSWAIFSVSLKMSARTFSTFYLFRNVYLLPSSPHLYSFQCLEISILICSIFVTSVIER